MPTVRVLENSSLASDTRLLSLEKPPGFSFTPGQFIVLQTVVEGKPMRRSYSIASAPHEDFLQVAVKAQPHGKVSPTLCGLREGTQVEVLGPFGMFTLPADTAPLVLIGAGTGIAPFISYVRSLAHDGDERAVTVLSSNRVPDAILYADELASSHARVLHTITRPTPDMDWEGLRGRIDQELLASLELPEEAWYCICGPTAMVTAVTDSLVALGVDKERVRTEKYGKIAA